MMMAIAGDIVKADKLDEAMQQAPAPVHPPAAQVPPGQRGLLGGGPGPRSRNIVEQAGAIRHRPLPPSKAAEPSAFVTQTIRKVTICSRPSGA